ncbi:hypothetical protein N0V90_005811 [Kalmusia sp. IMI 367209]|nr:hypothetical protein N0V90_005811 [Kalmusia sp. IMI 367209]
MSDNEQPAKSTPSSISRDKAGFFVFPSGMGMESILGKRKSELGPPARAKRPGPTNPTDDEERLSGPTDKVPDYTRRESRSSSPDVEEHELSVHESQDVSIGLFHPGEIIFHKARGDYYASVIANNFFVPVADVSENVDPPSAQQASRRSPATHDRDLTLASRKHNFKTRFICRRQSISALEHWNAITDETADTYHGQDAGGRPATDYLTFPTIYRIDCPREGSKSRHHETFLYEDDPLTAILTDSRRSSHLAGKRPIYHLQNYVRNFQQPSFVIIKNRQCQGLGLSRSKSGRDETMLILEDDLRQAIQRVSTCPLEKFMKDASLEMRAPYQLLYYHRELLQNYSQSVNSTLQAEIRAVIRYINTNYGHEYSQAEALMSEKKLTIRHLDKISWPNQLVVLSRKKFGDNRDGAGDIYVVQDWPDVTGSYMTLTCWCWKFTSDECTRTSIPFGFIAPVEDENEPFSLEKLGVYPFSLLSKESVDILRARGRKSWGLRRPNFVYCTGSDHTKEGRYMIDQMTYSTLHSGNSGWKAVSEFKTRNKRTDPWRLGMDFEAEPTEDEYLIMPNKIPGYDFLEKEWIPLPVSKITPIRWNKQPFEDLVLSEETKRLVRAMVTVRASSIKMKREQQRLRAGFDIISGKGNGLIMLFHGSPGTGKTLTAESVAEIAEMPLYPITCGDIGTDPEKVEQYLQLVFELGQRWNCVLLLDEADVFLEERTLTDLQRNSLVSVFLRMLEYYEGILILTSNRVGTFDEAFRSRIHIALHYEDLKPRSRKQIWSNFLGRLEDTEEGENVEDIRNRLDELANHKLNGREIRNALSTARQLASHEGKKMAWEHLQLAIRTANDFGKYLTEFHGHSDRDWARERKERW